MSDIVKYQGYTIKDKTARDLISTLQDAIKNLTLSSDKITISDDLSLEQKLQSINDSINNIIKNVDSKPDNAEELPYDELTSVAEKINELSNEIDGIKNEIVKSHIGMIIHSTTLDTMEKVIAKYGGTKWNKLEGVFLFGADSEYIVNTTGGNKSVNYTPQGINQGTSLTIAQIPKHTHKVQQGVYNVGAGSGSTVLTYLSGDTGAKTSETGGGGSHTHAFTGTETSIDTMPPFKAVYIWERTK